MNQFSFQFYSHSNMKIAQTICEYRFPNFVLSHHFQPKQPCIRLPKNIMFWIQITSILSVLIPVFQIYNFSNLQLLYSFEVYFLFLHIWWFSYHFIFSVCWTCLLKSLKINLLLSFKEKEYCRIFTSYYLSDGLFAQNKPSIKIYKCKKLFGQVLGV